MMLHYSGHMSDSAVDTPVLLLTPAARAQSFRVVALPSRLSVKSAPSISAPSNLALIRFAFVKSSFQKGMGFIERQ